MNKFVGAGMLAISILYGAAAADTLPQLPGTPLKPVWREKAVVAAEENGVYRLAAFDLALHDRRFPRKHYNLYSIQALRR